MTVLSVYRLKKFWPILQQFSLIGIAYTWIIKNKSPNGKKETSNLQAINIENYLFRTSFYQHFLQFNLYASIYSG